ncbi:MAG: CCA tRNA nucleotidyltransferase [Deltaproteobacteria bacterium]|nr:CCA tRNA nucleotidyltransferase [Deltaproteobacteria bacterium]
MRQLGKLAIESRSRAFIVGGMPRDLLLEHYCADVDILIEGDAIEYCSRLIDNWPVFFHGIEPPSSFVTFKKYKTAKLKFEQEIFPQVDLLEFASARKETYPLSGAAPIVEWADLDADLARRDFSINAMAVGLSPEDFGQVYDSFNGREDLKEGLLRVLHAESFVDDPVRILRGLRLVARFGLSFESTTEELFCRAIEGEFLRRVPWERLFDEMRKVLSEKFPAEILIVFERHKVLSQIEPLWSVSDDVLLSIMEASSGVFDSYLAISSNKPYVRWELLLVFLYKLVSEEDFFESLKKFKLSNSQIKRLIVLRTALSNAH